MKSRSWHLLLLLLLLPGLAHAAWILVQNIARRGYHWEAIGAYNATSPGKRQIYPSLPPRIFSSSFWVQLKVVDNERLAGSAGILPATNF